MRPQSETGDFTRLVDEHRAGSTEAGKQLLAVIYGELRRAAGAFFRQERPGHTLQPTALVHEAFLRLAGKDLQIEGRAHLVSIAARAMRRVLVDHSRRRNAAKRNAGGDRVTLAGLPRRDDESAFDALDVAAALEDLELISSRQREVVELRFFGGLSDAEAARVLDVSERTVRGDWRLARAMLRERLTAGDR